MPKRFIKMKQAGEKIAALTAYDATFAAAIAAAGADLILVGDSLGMVIKGEKDTLAVRLSEVGYHVRAVTAGAPGMFVVADMPFGTFQESPERAFANAANLLAAGATMVKLEGGREMEDTVRFLTERGVPVCAHIGLLPQSVRASGGYRVQGRDEESAARLHQDAQSMEQAGAALMVLELLSCQLAASVSAQLSIPTIGIGSGGECDGQILVLYDMLGMSAQDKRFVRNFMADTGSIPAAFRAYVEAVKKSEFPALANSF